MAQVKSPIVDILKAIKTAIKTSLGITNETTVKIVARDDLPIYSGDFDVLIKANLPYPIEEFVSGAGRTASVVLRTITIVIRTRLGVDRSDTDERALMDPIYGHLRREEQILNCLHLKFLNNTNGDMISVEPVRLSEPNSAWGEIAHYNKEDSDKSSQRQVSRSFLNFEVKYIMDVA
jgi:hypothetical protein